jgi:hypothetical protein
MNTDMDARDNADWVIEDRYQCGAIRIVGRWNTPRMVRRVRERLEGVPPRRPFAAADTGLGRMMGNRYGFEVHS